MSTPTDNQGNANIKKPFWKKWWVWVGAVVLAIGLGIGGAALFVSSTEAQVAEEKCRDAVSAKAKYPSGVEFIEFSEMEKIPTENNNSRFSNFGEVDFPNGFGTPVRHTFICDITVFGADVVDSEIDVYSGSLSSLTENYGN